MSITIRVLSISGNLLTTITDALPSWTCRCVADSLEIQAPLLPGHEYKFTCGDQVVAGEVTLDKLVTNTSTADSALELVAITSRKENAQQELDLALIEAGSKLDSERVAALLAAGANAAFLHDPPGTWGAKDCKTALHMVLEHGRREGSDKAVMIELVKDLLAAKADINAKRCSSDWRGSGFSQTAFEMALKLAENDASLLELFLAAGADPNTKSRRSISSMRSDGQIVQCLLNVGVQSNNHAFVKVLLEAKADVNAKDKDIVNNERGFDRNRQEAGLHLACAEENLQMVALLLAHGADVNLARQDLEQTEREDGMESTTDDPREDGYVSPVVCVPIEETALHIAIRNANLALTAMLVAKGANVTCKRKHGESLTSPTDLCNKDEQLLQVLQATDESVLMEFIPEDLQNLMKSS